MSTTFTKFDRLGSALTELSFDAGCLNFTRNDDGSISHYSVYLHQGGECWHGVADTPSQALEKALSKFCNEQINRLEQVAA